MQAWKRPRLWLRGLPIVGLFVALALVVNRGRGQAIPDDTPECAAQEPWNTPAPSPTEPPMVDAPASPQSPTSPFTPPAPTPLAPGQSVPYAPELPFGPGNLSELPEPVVRLRVHAPAKVQPDKEIEYRLTVENVSRADAHHVLVRDRLPRGMEENASAEPKETRQDKTKNGSTDFIWDLGTLKAGSHKDIVLSLKPKGAEEVQNSAYVQFEHGQTVKTKITQPAVGLRIVAPSESTSPNPIVFRLEVTNNGETTIQDVVLRCELPDRLVYGHSKPPLSSDKLLQWKLGAIKPGETRRVELEAIPTQPGSYTCKAEITASGGLNKKTSVNVTVGEAKLSISTSGPQRRLVNRPIPYLITVSNQGTMPLTNVQVADAVPQGVVFDSASPGGRLQQGQVRWLVGTLGPGERRPLWLVIRAPKPAWCGNAVTASADQKQFDKARSNMTRVDPASGPAIEIDRSSDWLEVGQKATYTLRLINSGKKAVFNTSLVITIPPEMNIRGQRGKTSGHQDGQIIRFDPLEVLDPDKKEEYVVEVEAQKAGEARLHVSITDGRKESSVPEEWDDKTIIREAGKLAPRPAPTSLQVRLDEKQ